MPPTKLAYERRTYAVLQQEMPTIGSFKRINLVDPYNLFSSLAEVVDRTTREASGLDSLPKEA
jgi:hypothetical protein